MATTNFTIKQGETWSKVLNIESSDCIPSRISDTNGNPSMYFSGMAAKTGETSIPIRFKYGEVETKTYGRGSGRETVSGIFDLIVYIPADEVGYCSVPGKTSRSECLSSSGSWTVSSSESLLTTINMAEGDWDYEIRKGESSNVSGPESSDTILHGTMTVEKSFLDLSSGSEFTFVSPD